MMMMEGKLTYAGQEIINGKTCYILKGIHGSDIPPTEGAFTVCIDTKTYMVHVLKQPVQGMPDVDHIAIQQGDYKTVDGIKVPFSIAVSLESKPVISIKFKKVTHGVDISDALFTMPKD